MPRTAKDLERVVPVYLEADKTDGQGAQGSGDEPVAY
jgi:hypothetical protein